MILDRNFLVAHPVPQKDASGYVERAQRQMVWILAAQIRVGERDRQLVIVIADGRTQEKRTGAVDVEHQTGDKSRSVVIEALLARCDGLDVAIAVENSKRVTMLEDAIKSIRQAWISNDGVGAIARPGAEESELPFTR